MTPPDYLAGIDATWPAARYTDLGPWVLRQGDGGGKRVSSASAKGDVTPADIIAAEEAMMQMEQTPLFQIRLHDHALDTQLAALNYRLIDPVRILAAPIEALTSSTPPPISTFLLPDPLEIMKELWAEGGIGPERLAVMQRVGLPKTSVLGRVKDRASGVAFAAIHEKTVFCHALEVTEGLRRQGTAVNMLRAAAIWAQENGAETFATLVLDNNSAARALFSSLNFQDVGHYHYRIKLPAEERA